MTPGNTTIGVDFTAPEWVGTSPLTGYKIRYRRRTLGRDPWTTVTAGGSSTTHSLRHLVSGSQYRVEVTAVNSVGESRKVSSDTTTTSSTTTPSVGLAPSGTSTTTVNGVTLPTITAGSTLSMDLTMSSSRGYSQIYWYLAAPSVTGLGTQIGSPTRSTSTSIETSFSHSFSIPTSSQRGTYTVTAYIYPHSSESNQSVYEYSFEIYIN